MTPDDRAHAHRARLAGRIDGAAHERIRAVLGEAAPDRDHLAMRRGVMRRAAEIAPAGDHRALAHDDRAERKVRAPGLVQRHAHERRILGRGGIAGLGERGRG